MNLLASSLWGGLYLVILFALCFALVTGARCLRLRAARGKKAEPSEQKPSETAAEKADEKQGGKKEQRVYYIVEKKRVRKDPSKYSEPKKIRFE